MVHGPEVTLYAIYSGVDTKIHIRKQVILGVMTINNTRVHNSSVSPDLWRVVLWKVAYQLNLTRKHQKKAF